MPTALITGATAGIGAAFARRLAADGFSLVLVARDGARLEQAAAEHRRRYGVATETIAADLTTEEGMAAVEARLRDGVDLLVNNAGFGHRDPFPAVPLRDELAMLRLHCEAVLRFTHAVLPYLRKKGRGGVINVASVAAFFPRGTYSASKAWVVSFSRSLAAELAGTGVRVMALCPGFVRTEFHRRAGMNAAEIPSFLWLDADRVVRAALRDLARGRWTSVPDVRYKAVVAVGRLLPIELTGRISARLGRRLR